jgi:hypothetical protein
MQDDSGAKLHVLVISELSQLYDAVDILLGALAGVFLNLSEYFGATFRVAALPFLESGFGNHSDSGLFSARLKLTS